MLAISVSYGFNQHHPKTLTLDTQDNQYKGKSQYFDPDPRDLAVNNSYRKALNHFSDTLDLETESRRLLNAVQAKLHRRYS